MTNNDVIKEVVNDNSVVKEGFDVLKESRLMGKDSNELVEKLEGLEELVEKDDIEDSGIVGISEAEELKKELDDLKAEYNELDSMYNDVCRDLENAEEQIEVMQNEFDKDEIKSDVMVAIATHLTRDGLLTPELEEWLDNFGRFYLDEV